MQKRDKSPWCQNTTSNDILVLKHGSLASTGVCRTCLSRTCCHRGPHGRACGVHSPCHRRCRRHVTICRFCWPPSALSQSSSFFSSICRHLWRPVGLLTAASSPPPPRSPPREFTWPSWHKRGPGDGQEPSPRSSSCPSDPSLRLQTVPWGLRGSVSSISCPCDPFWLSPSFPPPLSLFSPSLTVSHFLPPYLSLLSCTPHMFPFPHSILIFPLLSINISPYFLISPSSLSLSHPLPPYLSLSLSPGSSYSKLFTSDPPKSALTALLVSTSSKSSRLTF